MEQISDIQDSYSLSPIQQGMLFHSLYNPRSGVYVQQVSCDLHEALNVSAFKEAWQLVVARHPVLRTAFRWEGLDWPVQDVHRCITIPWEERDWRSLCAREQEDRLAAYLETDRRRGFVFDKVPPMRVMVFRLDEADYRFVWTSHHALLDGRSYVMVLKELFSFYDAYLEGRNLVLPQPRPYRDYIDWLEKQDLSNSKMFWRNMLEGFVVPTALVLEQTHQATSDEEGKRGKLEVRLSERLTQALESLAQRHELTPNTLLQGAWALLLSRYTRQGDIVFGATRAARHTTLDGAEAMVGSFINTLPVRVRVSAEISLLPWLKELRGQWIAVRQYEHTPLVKIQEWSDVPAGKPLFESLLVFENYTLNTSLGLQNRGWQNRYCRLLGTTNYSLTLTGYLEPEFLLGIAYDRRRFNDTTITRMLGHLQSLLESIVANPDQRLSELPILTEAERHQLLVEWNATKRDYPKDKCIHQLFESQVERTPDVVAAVFEDEQLTYRELNKRANQLGHYLQKRGVGSENLVGICVERSLDLIVALLAVLKAGGAYVPLDPAYPKDRLAFLLENSAVSVVLTHQQLLDRLPKHKAHNTVCIDTDWKTIAQEHRQNPPSKATPGNLAYVIYTSGSTGKPNAVMIEHHSLVSYLCWVNESLIPNGLESVPVVSRLNFDGSLKQLFAPLIRGGQVWALSDDVVTQPAALMQALGTRATVGLNCVPSLWVAILDATDSGQAAAPAENFTSLFLGGERLTKELVQKSLAALSHLQIWNLYGPTETTANATAARILPEGELTIGRPIANTQIYILGPSLNPVPIGVPGELYIGGIGLARGYLNRPDLTAEKFVPNPFSTQPGARLYKSGDLARYLDNGNIEFLGRLDDQVKIRGFRIELGEIEAVLGQHLSVQQVIVLAREDMPGEKRLVAYIVPNPKEAPSVSQLRGYLKQKLPDHMVPSAFVFLDALPLTPNGKVDRRALSAPDTARPDLEAVFVAPRTAVEKTLAEIWAKVLGLERVGIHDNFFDLGGHSLLATQVVSRIRGAFQIELPLRSLFERPTIAALADAIEKAKDDGVEQPPLPIMPLSRELRRIGLTSPVTSKD